MAVDAFDEIPDGFEVAADATENLGEGLSQARKIERSIVRLEENDIVALEINGEKPDAYYKVFDVREEDTQIVVSVCGRRSRGGHYELYPGTFQDPYVRYCPPNSQGWTRQLTDTVDRWECKS